MVRYLPDGDIEEVTAEMNTKYTFYAITKRIWSIYRSVPLFEETNEYETLAFWENKTNATLQKSEGSLWHTRELHFDNLWAKAIFNHSAS